MPDGNIKVLVEGVERAKSIEVNDRDGFFVATVRTGKTDFEMTPAVEQLMQRVTLFEQYVKLQQSLNYETIIATVRMDEPAKLSDTIAANLQLGIEEKQELLAIFDPAARLARIADVLDIEIEKADLDRNIQSRVKRQMERRKKSTTSTRRSRPSRRSWAAARRASSTSCARRSKPPACPRTCSTRPSRS
jgi:ATP-dependent Lon protease